MLHTKAGSDTTTRPDSAQPRSALERTIIKLPAPGAGNGKTLMQALQERRSTREFSDKKVSLDVLSNLLWAGFGINRPKSGGRTAPSAQEWHEIQIYVATADGVYLYDGRSHTLTLLSAQDIRAQTGLEPFAADAPVNLIYVADHARMVEAAEEERILYSAADAGFISQNVCLFCASEGLATVVRGQVARSALAKLMKLRPSQRIILAQSVGYPFRTI